MGVDVGKWDNKLKYEKYKNKRRQTSDKIFPNVSTRVRTERQLGDGQAAPN